MFGNPIYFIAFLAEVINKALTYKENSDINIFEIIFEAAGKRMGLSVKCRTVKISNIMDSLKILQWNSNHKS